MTSYKHQILDFVDRTLMILDQYNHVKALVGQEKSYEVTLLVNCLMGLLIIPQQLGQQQDYKDEFETWLNDIKVVPDGAHWGIDPEWIKSPGFKNDKTQVTSVNDLTMRNLLRQMRNTAAHASVSLLPMATEGQKIEIERVEFRELKENPLKTDKREDLYRKNGFHLEIPVWGLEQFVRKLANETAEKIVAMAPNNPQRIYKP